MMANKTVMNGATFQKRYVVLQRLMDDSSNRILLIYCCSGILLFSFYQFQINPDGVSYINIAHLYASRDIHDVINGYWGPLISWLLVPFLLAKFQSLFAFKILSLIIGFFTLIAIRKLSYRFALNERMRLLISLTAIPMLLSYSFLLVTPDLLFVCISLYYLYYIFDTDYSREVTYGYIIGFLGAFLYFSKSYGFYFFIAHFSLFTIIYFLKAKTHQERRNVLLKYMIGLTIFLIASGIWIYSISNKYQHFTISTSGEYNQKLDSIGSQGQPMLHQGLLPLSYPAAVSAWDDPSYLTIDYETSPRSFDLIKYQIVHIGNNVFQTLSWFEKFSIFSIAIIAIGLLYAIRYSGKRFREAEEDIQNPEGSSWRRQLQYNSSHNDGKVHISTFYALITILLYTAGYELLHLESRFLWIDAMLLLLLCAYYVYNYHFNFVRNAKLRRFLFLIIFFSFWLYPISQLIIHVNEDRDIYLISKQLQTAYHLKGNIASNDNELPDSWGISLYYAYFADSKYYGATQKKVTDEELQREFRKYHIDYYFVWNSVCRLSDCRKILEIESHSLWIDKTEHLIIYQIKNNGSL